MFDRTAYLPGTMTLARQWTPRPAAGSTFEAYLAWHEANCPGGEFNASLAAWCVDDDTEHLSAKCNATT